GYTGSNGLAVVPAAGGGGEAAVRDGRPQFLTDFRYVAQAAAEVAPDFERSTVAGELRDSLPELLPEGWELIDANGLLDGLRVIKEPGEIERIAAACELADEALREVLEGGLVGRTEREVAFELETAMRRRGAEAPSFGSIVASGSHGALPHAQPRDVEIPRDVLVTIDWGAVHDGYCSDCTRTYATGEGIGEEAREIY